MVREAGESALAMYRSARRRRRRRAATGLLMVFLAGAGLVVGLPAALVGCVLGVGLLMLVVAVAGRRGRDPERWRRGAEGELRTAELLAALPSRRWAVWHDLQVPGSRANIDHVVIGRTGVWVVDSKATRAEVRAGWRSVRFGGGRLDTGPTLWEAEVVTAQLCSRLEDGARARPPVRPIVAVHGTGLRRRGKRVGGVRVVPAEALLERVLHGRRRLRRRERDALVGAMVEAFGPPAAGVGRAGGRRDGWGRRDGGGRDVAAGTVAP